jgi:hypothetical protein
MARTQSTMISGWYCGHWHRFASAMPHATFLKSSELLGTRVHPRSARRSPVHFDDLVTATDEHIDELVTLIRDLSDGNSCLHECPGIW